MAFDGLNLNPYSSVKSSAGTRGMSNLPMLENKAKARLLANQYANEQAIEAAKLGYQAQLDAFKPKETSWGDVAMGVFGSASQAGLFDNFGLSGTDKMVARDNAMYGNSFPAGSFGIGSSPSDVATRHLSPSGSSFQWYNPFSWGQN